MLIRYSRPLTDRERDVLSVAAELARTQLDDRIPEDVALQMRSWAMRLKSAHDELLGSLWIPTGESVNDALHTN